MGLMRNTDKNINEEEIRLYAAKNGLISAIDFLLLVPPDKFDGDWQKVYDDLQSSFYWGNSYGNGSAETGSSEI